MTPLETAKDLLEHGSVELIATYIATARQYHRFAKYFEQMMLNDLTMEYDQHVTDSLNDPKYDKAYLCIILDKARAAVSETGV